MNSSTVRKLLGWTLLSGITLSFAPSSFAVRGGQSASANAEVREPERIESPYFHVQGTSDDVALDAFPLKSTEVDVVISGMIADVEVSQVYGNASLAPLEAVYVFPASVHCAVHGMEMQIGDQVTKAVVKKRAAARATYEQARSAKKNASLLEEERPNVFKMSVANILPGDDVRVTLRFTEYLKPTDGIYEYVYPTVVGPRYAGGREGGAGAEARGHEDWVANPFLSEGQPSPSEVKIRVRLNGGLPLQQVRCSSHDVDVQFADPTSATVSLKDSDRNAGDRDFILRYHLKGREIESGLLLHEAQENDDLQENFFLLTVQPPERVRSDQIVPRDYVFVMDVSGSMAGFPLDVSKALLEKLIGGLQAHETFNVLLFAGGSHVLSSRSMPANQRNIGKALRFIDRGGGGGTNLLPALKQAFDLPLSEGRSRSIVVVTDGYVTVEKEAFDLIQRNLGTAGVFAFGIGSSVNRYLIEGLARVGRGEPAVITKPSEAEARARQFREYIEAPVLTDIDVRFEGFDAYEVEPAAFPDVYAQRPLVVFGKWKGARVGSIQVVGARGNGQAIKKQFRVNDEVVGGAVSNPALPYLWARERIARLSDYDAGLHAASDRQKNEDAVTALGLTYNLLTKHTSFVAVQEEARSFEGEAHPVKQPLPLPQGVSNSAIGNAPEVPGGRSQSGPMASTSTSPPGKRVSMSAPRVRVRSSGGGSGSSSVPEPSSALLILVAALFGLLQRRRT